MTRPTTRRCSSSSFDGSPTDNELVKVNASYKLPQQFQGLTQGQACYHRCHTEADQGRNQAQEGVVCVRARRVTKLCGLRILTMLGS